MSRLPDRNGHRSNPGCPTGRGEQQALRGLTSQRSRDPEHQDLAQQVYVATVGPEACVVRSEVCQSVAQREEATMPNLHLYVGWLCGLEVRGRTRKRTASLSRDWGCGVEAFPSRPQVAKQQLWYLPGCPEHQDLTYVHSGCAVRLRSACYGRPALHRLGTCQLCGRSKRRSGSPPHFFR